MSWGQKLSDFRRKVSKSFSDLDKRRLEAHDKIRKHVEKNTPKPKLPKVTLPKIGHDAIRVEKLRAAAVKVAKELARPIEEVRREAQGFLDNIPNAEILKKARLEVADLLEKTDLSKIDEPTELGFVQHLEQLHDESLLKTAEALQRSISQIDEALERGNALQAELWNEREGLRRRIAEIGVMPTLSEMREFESLSAKLDAISDEYHRVSDGWPAVSAKLELALKSLDDNLFETESILDAMAYAMDVLESAHDGFMAGDSLFQHILGRTRNDRGGQEDRLRHEWEKVAVIEYEITALLPIALAIPYVELLDVIGKFLAGASSLETLAAIQREGIDLKKPFSVGTFLVHHERNVGDWRKEFKQGRWLKTHVGTYYYIVQMRRFEGRYRLYYSLNRTYLGFLAKSDAPKPVEEHEASLLEFRSHSGYHSIVCADNGLRLVVDDKCQLGLAEASRTDNSDLWWLDESNLWHDSHGVNIATGVSGWKGMTISPRKFPGKVLVASCDGSDRPLLLLNRDDTDDSLWIHENA